MYILDLLSAFDTIDIILLSRLQEHFEVQSHVASSAQSFEVEHENAPIKYLLESVALIPQKL